MFRGFSGFRGPIYWVVVVALANGVCLKRRVASYGELPGPTRAKESAKVRTLEPVKIRALKTQTALRSSQRTKPQPQAHQAVTPHTLFMYLSVFWCLPTIRGPHAS